MESGSLESVTSAMQYIVINIKFAIKNLRLYFKKYTYLSLNQIYNIPLSKNVCISWYIRIITQGGLLVSLRMKLIR